MPHTESTGQLLWSPSASQGDSVMNAFIAWLRDEKQLAFAGYDDLWQWSVTEVGAFWGTLAEYLGVRFHEPASVVVEPTTMPEAKWFPGATLNYAEHALHKGDAPAILGFSQTRGAVRFTRDELRDCVARIRQGLVDLGVQRGDTVAAYMPNIPETVAAFLATASLGAIWASCAPEFGMRSVLDRLRQVGPKVLLVVDGYRFGERDFDRMAAVEEMRSELPTVEAVVVMSYLNAERALPKDVMAWSTLVEKRGPLEFASVPFDHPLYILFSSGTTGLPKPIVHGHGGMVLEHLKWLHLHLDLRDGERFFQVTTTGWMAWNLSVSALLTGAAIVTFDGNPIHPDHGFLWGLVTEAEVQHFSASAPYLVACRKNGIVPREEADLSALRSLTSSGAPLPTAAYQWIYANVGSDILLSSASGGTDVCSAFVGMNPLVPVYAGEISRPFLGARVEAYDDSGQPVIGQQGELVLTVPMPSMPVCFWNDPGDKRYHESYFDRFPGVWAHGDWITFTDRGTCIITGRSDATLNRGGVRLGTSEFYSAVEEIDDVSDSLVVHLEDAEGGTGELLLFIVLSPGATLNAELEQTIESTLRTKLSPRHVPNRIVEVPTIPRNVTGKKMEVPVKRLLARQIDANAEAFHAIGDAEALKPFLAVADALVD